MALKGERTQIFVPFFFFLFVLAAPKMTYDATKAGLITSSNSKGCMTCHSRALSVVVLAVASLVSCYKESVLYIFKK